MKIKLIKVFPAFFLRVQLCPSPAPDCVHVFTDALHPPLQGNDDDDNVLLM